MGHGMGRRFAGGAPVAVFGGSPVGNAPKSADTAFSTGLPPRSETGEEYINKTHKDSLNPLAVGKVCEIVPMHTNTDLRSIPKFSTAIHGKI